METPTMDILTRIRTLRSIPSLIANCGRFATDCLRDAEAEITRLREEVGFLKLHRERAATNHDAAPAAKAAELARSPGQSPRGTGDTPTLTDAERAFLRRLQPSENPLGSYPTAISPEDRKTVFGLLARHGGER